MQLSHKNIHIWVSFLHSTKENHSCALVFGNFCCLINLKIATNNLSETNSFLPLKAVLYSSTRGPVTSFKQALALILLLSELVQFLNTSENHRGLKKRFFFFSFSEMNQFTQEVWQVSTAMGRAVIETTASCSSKVSNWGHIKLHWFLYTPGWPWWSLSPYRTHTYMTRIFFLIQSCILNSVTSHYQSVCELLSPNWYYL